MKSLTLINATASASPITSVAVVLLVDRYLLGGLIGGFLGGRLYGKVSAIFLKWLFAAFLFYAGVKYLL